MRPRSVIPALRATPIERRLVWSIHASRRAKPAVRAGDRRPWRPPRSQVRVPQRPGCRYQVSDRDTSSPGNRDTEPMICCVPAARMVQPHPPFAAMRVASTSAAGAASRPWWTRLVGRCGWHGGRGRRARHPAGEARVERSSASSRSSVRPPWERQLGLEETRLSCSRDPSRGDVPAVGDRVAPDQVCRDFLSIVEEVSYVHHVIRMFQESRWHHGCARGHGARAA